MQTSEKQPRFHGKQALVSGGGSGIGRAVALALAAEGARVRIVGRDEGNLAETAREGGGRIEPIRCDIGDAGRWRDVIASEPRLDILINNAAISLATDVFDPDETAWNRLFSINFQGTWQGCREAARVMRAGGGGRIVNVTSVHGQLCERGSAAYGVAKAAVNQLTRCLAVELAPHGILVNAVAPGFVDTPMSRASGVNELETDWFRKGYLESGRIPLGRAAQPGEIAPAILFLAGPENSYVTGQIVTVDGGLSLTL